LAVHQSHSYLRVIRIKVQNCYLMAYAGPYYSVPGAVMNEGI